MARQWHNSHEIESGEPEGEYSHFDHWTLTHWLLAGLFLLGVLYTLYFASVILIPVTVAVILAFLLNPLVRRLGRIGLPDWI